MGVKLCAIYGSPRKKGNTATLLNAAVQGARSQGAEVVEIHLRKLKIAPCMEIYGCKKNGECSIKDDFQAARDAVMASKGIMIASPIFFYSVSAQIKTFMDRFQSQWVRKYWIDKVPFGKGEVKRQGIFISAAATHGSQVFDGALSVVKYFLDTVDAALWESLLYRGLDFEGDVREHPEYIEEARQAGAEFARIGD